MLEWFAITYNAARLGLEAQNAAAFRLLRAAGGITKTAADEIIPDYIAAPVAAAPERRSAASKVHKKSTAVKKRSKGTK